MAGHLAAALGTVASVFLLGCTNPLAAVGSVSKIESNYGSTAISNSLFSFNSANSSNLSFGSTVQLSATAAQLAPLTSDRDNSTLGFSTASMSGVQWDSGSSVVRLNTSINSASLDASWAPAWSNLVGYWKLDETSGSTLVDSSSTGANGSYVGSYTLGATGKVGTAVSFSGAGYAQTGVNTALNSASHSVCTWVYSASTQSQYTRILEKGGYGTGNGFGLEIYDLTTSDINFIEWSSGNPCRITGPAALPYQVWTHICGTYDSSSSTANLYVNGFLMKSATCASATAASAISIGRAYGAATNYWNGSIDEVAEWNSVLTAAQIQNLYQRQSAQYSGVLTSRVMDAKVSQSLSSFNYSTSLPFMKELSAAAVSEGSASYSGVSANLTSGLAGLWRFDEAAGTSGSSSLLDSSGGGNHATPSGTYTMGSLGILGTSMMLDGSTGYATASSTNLPSGSVDRTVSVWFYPLATNKQSVLSFGIWSPHSMMDMYISGSTLTVDFGGAGATVGGITVGAWNHAVYTFSNGTMTGYINGNLATSTSGITLTTGAGNLYFGYGYWSAQSAYGGTKFNGAIDEAAIWTRVLSATEIAQLYRRGANRLKFQVRSCATADCSDQSALSGQGWKGPDNTNQTYFSELYNTSSNILGGTVQTSSALLSFANFAGFSLSSNRYYQYRSVFESDDKNQLCSYSGAAASCSPELQSVTLGSGIYDNSSPSIVVGAGAAIKYTKLTSFAETLGSAGCSSGIRYALSPDGANYYYWSASSGAWVSSSLTAATASLAVDVNTNIAKYNSAVGSGSLQVVAFLLSTGASACQLSSLQVGSY